MSRAHFALRDTTTSTGNIDDTQRYSFQKSNPVWGNSSIRLRTSVEVTPKANRPATPIGAGAAQYDTPQSAARAALTPRSAVKIPTFITPQKPLFQQYLLKEIEPGQPKPTLTVVLDLDETLVSNRRADLTHAILRPYALHVLNALRHMQGLEIVLWTASTRETGAPVVEQLHEGGLVFDDVIFRNDLWFTEPVHTKDLRLLGRDMDRVVVFDNAPNCCKLNPQNAVLVEDFLGARVENDAALVNCYYIIESLLKQASGGVPVREGLSRLIDEGHLCRAVFFQLPEAWSKTNLRDVVPLRIPPHGKYVKAHTMPPNLQTMKHWTF